MGRRGKEKRDTTLHLFFPRSARPFSETVPYLRVRFDQLNMLRQPRRPKYCM